MTADRVGNCYRLALEATLGGDQDAVLVHGRAAGFGRHAWVERDGVVHDLVSNTETPASAYRGACERRYTKEEAIVWATLSGHAGPWFPYCVRVGWPVRRATFDL